MSARMAVWRWAWRLLRKDWRGQALIFGLIFVVVTLSVAGGLLAFHALPEEGVDSRTLFTLDGAAGDVDRVTATFGDDAGEIRRGEAQLAGSVELLALQAFDPGHPQTSPLIAVVDGRLPRGVSEIAATADMLDTLAADVGQTVEIDGVLLTVVGEVENPTDLDDEFVFFDVSDPPPVRTESQFITDRNVDDIVGPFEGGITVIENQSPGTIIKVLSNVVMTFAMVLVGLVASASFGVVARRRVRQFGLLGAIGANDNHLRGAAAFNGFAVGGIAAIVGAALGVFVAAALLPSLEETLDHRIDFSAPLAIWLTAIVVATTMSTIAAWWPARAISRQPIVEALAARRPKTRPVRNTTVIGLVVTGAGYVLLGYAATKFSVPAAIGGVLLAVIGVLLLTPATISAIGVIAGRAPLSARIAGRNLARFQGRAAAALGAIVLALAIPVAVGVITASFDARDAAEPPNLADNTAIVWSPGIVFQGREMLVADSNGNERSNGVIATIAEQFPSFGITPIEIAVISEERVSDDGRSVRPVRVTYTPSDCRSTGETYGWDGVCFQARALWIATPELGELWSFDVAGKSGILADTDEQLFTLAGANNGDNVPMETPTIRAAFPVYSSYAPTLVTEDAMEPGDERLTAGWILTSPQSLTADDIEGLRLSASNGGAVETLSIPTPATGLRTIAALIGMVVGFAILAATVTLIIGESSKEARVLDVLGASLNIRRRVAGATAAYLALGGAVLAIPLGFVGLIIARAGESGVPVAIPWSTLAMLFVLFPAIAALATGMLAGDLKENQ